MAATLSVSCPHCQNPLKVPAELAGKVIRCKKCAGTFAVPAAGRPVAAKPAAARPVAAKPVAAAPPPVDAAIPLKPDDAPIGFKDEPAKSDGDDDENPYTVAVDDSDVPRCPFCAKELDPPDTKICLNCGYDLVKRKRHDTVKTIDYTFGDYAAHLGPGIACVVAVITLLVFDYVALTNMRDWMTGGIFDQDEKDLITGNAKFYVSPYCFNLWLLIVTGFLMFLLGKFAYLRLVVNWKPEEKVVKDLGGDD